MKTYITIMFTSEGAKPSEVKSRLMGLGFKAMRGSYDFFYEWEREPDIETLLDFADRIHTALEGMNVMFSLETV